MSEYICYGDQIYIELSLLHAHSVSQARLLSSTAFLDDSVYAVKTTDYKLSDFRSCVFTMLPPLVNDQDDLGFVESLEKELSLLSKSTAEYRKGQEYLKNQLEARREQLREMREDIRVLNAKLAEEKAQKEIHYGEVVVLQHLESGCYLSVEVSKNVRARNLNGLRLQKEATPGCYFRIHSVAIEHQRGPVEYTREIKLVSVQLGTMLVMVEPEEEGGYAAQQKRKEEEEEERKDKKEQQRQFLKRTMISYEDIDIEEKLSKSPPARLSEKDPIDFDAGAIRGEKGVESFDPDKFEVGTSVESEEFSRIRLFEYCSRKSQEGFKSGQIIKSGDYVRFEIEDMFLTAAKTPRKQFVTLYGAYREEWNTHNLVDSVFQVVGFEREQGYPKGRAIKSVPKMKINDIQGEKIVLKHLMTGQYLTVPDEGLVAFAPPNEEEEEENLLYEKAQSDVTPKQEQEPLAYFKLVNNDLRAEKNHITKGSLVGLVVYAGGDDKGKWYMTKGRIEKKWEVDYKLEHFVGKTNTIETVEGVLHTKTKDLTVSKDTGRFFKIDSLEPVEVRKIMEFACYGKVLGEMEDTMQDIILGDHNESTIDTLIKSIGKTSQVAEKLLTALKGGRGDIQEVLSGFEGNVHTLIREFKILDSICRLLWWFFVKQRIHLLLKEKEKSGDLDATGLVKLLHTLIQVVLESTRDTIVTHIYLAQYLRVFLLSLLSPSTLLEKVSKDQKEGLKTSLTILLSKLISDRTLHSSPIVSQLNTYQGHIFMHIDAHADYSTYILQLLTCFFRARPATAQDTLLRAFITRYLSNQNDLQLLFPQINSVPKHQDFQIQFKRAGYPDGLILSTAPPEVFEYLLWAFALLNALLDSGSLRVKYATLKFYDIWVCWDLITSQKVPANLRSKVLGIVRKAHLGYKKLPFERVPSKLRFTIHGDFLRSYLEAFEGSIKETKDTLLRPIERDQLEGTTLQEKGTFRFSMEGLREKILQTELERIMRGKLDDLAFGLEVMDSILESGIQIETEEVLKMYHCIAEIVWRSAQEVGVTVKSQYYRALIENYDQILNVLTKIDQKMIQRAVQDTLTELEKGLEDADFKVNQSGKDFSKDFEKNVEKIFSRACESWKSKDKLYTTKVEKDYTEKYSEATLRKGLWRVVEAEPSSSAGGIIALLRKKVGFEAEVAEELQQYAFISNETELIGIVELATNVLNLYKKTRHLQAEVEFEDKDSIKTLNAETLAEVIRSLENIILIVYDYEAHLLEEENIDVSKGPRRIFIERLGRCKRRKLGVEVPFEYKEKFIKKDFQKALRMFNAYKVVLVLLDYLFEPDLFGVGPEDEELMMAAALVGIILRLFVEGNAANKHLLSNYGRFMQVFHEKAKATSTLEFLGIFSEVCLENKILVNVEEIPVYRVTLGYFLNFLQEFSILREPTLVESYLPVMILGKSHFLFLSNLPRDLFAGVRMINSILNDLIEFLGEEDNPLSMRDLVEKSRNEDGSITIEVPPLYSLIKEFWKLEVWLASTEKKENILVMQSRFIGNALQSFLLNENIMFHMELKELMLLAFEALHYKSQYTNYEVFESEELLDDVMECLLVDVYWYLKEKIKDPEVDSLLGLLESNLLVKLNPKIMARYRDFLQDKDVGLGNLEVIEIVEYQSSSQFGKLRKNYIYFLLCDFLYSLAENYRKYFTAIKNKSGETKTMFELWARLMLRLREIEEDRLYVLRINEVLRKAMILSEYSVYKDFVMENVESEEQEKKKVQEEEEKKIRLRDDKKFKNILRTRDAVQVLGKFFETDSHYKWKAKLANIMDVAKDVEKRKGLIEQLVKLLKRRTTSGKDIRFIIRILRRIVEFEIISVEGTQQNDNFNKPIYLWKALSSEMYEQIRGVQNLLNDKNIVEAIFDLLYRQAKNPKLVREALTLSITLLYGGNKNVQDSFYEFFKVDFENTIFENLSDLLEEILDDLLSKEERRLKRNYYKALKFLFKYFGELNLKFSKDIHVRDEVKQEVAQRFYKELEPRDRKNAISTKAYRLVLVIFTFLQLLCEGHNGLFQEFLRDQRVCGHAKSFNLLTYIKELYQEYYKSLSRFNIELGIKTLNLMIEMQQGPSKANSDILLTESLVYTLCSTLYARNTGSDLDLLARGFEFNPDEENYLDLKQKCSILLLGIFEKGDPELHKNMGKYIDYKVCIRNLRDHMVKFLENKAKDLVPKRRRPKAAEIQMDDINIEDLWDPYLNMAMNAYMVLRYLSVEEQREDFSPDIQKAIEDITQNSSPDSNTIRLYMYIMKFLKDYTASIEIQNNKTGQITKVFFPVPIDFYYMTDETRDNFVDNVDRSNTQTKVADLIRRSEHLMSHMEMEYFSRHRPFNLNYNKLYKSLRDITHAVAVIIALINLLTLTRLNGDTYQDPIGSTTTFVLNVVQIILSLLLLMLFWLTRLNKHLTNTWEKFIENSINKGGSKFGLIPPGATQGSIHTQKDGNIVLKLKGPSLEQSVEIFSRRFWPINTLFVLRSKYFLWHLTYFSICVMSVFHPIIAALQLFDIAFNSDTVSRITLVIVHNAQQFMWTITMLLITMFIYTMIAFFFLQDRFVSDKYGNLCDDSYECFIAILNIGLRAGGGIAEEIEPINYNPNERFRYLLYSFFDLSFYVIIILMLLNFIFGMIIDAFVELRNRKNRVEEDKKNVCFICGMQRSEYERYADFDRHILQEHNYWHYIAYLLYLRHKNTMEPTELTDTESYVLERYMDKDTIWVPVGRSLTLERSKAKVKEEETGPMKNIEGSVEEQRKQLEREIEGLRSQMKESLEKIKEKLK